MKKEVYSAVKKVAELENKIYGMKEQAESDNQELLELRELAEVKFFDKLPDKLTYPLVTPVLFEETAKAARKFYYMKQVEENR